MLQRPRSPVMRVTLSIRPWPNLALVAANVRERAPSAEVLEISGGGEVALDSDFLSRFGAAASFPSRKAEQRDYAMLKAGRAAEMEMLPIYLKLEGRACLVVGAGTIAAPKIDSLLRAGAAVTVVAPRALPVVEQQASEGRIRWVAREFTATDLDGMFLVITGTDVRAVNHAVAEEARGRAILCNSVDDPPDCDFFYPSVVRRGDLQIAISTAGKSPALAQRLRAEIDTLLPQDAGRWLDELGELRMRILEAFPLSDGRKQALHLLARRESCDAAACPVHALLATLAHESAGDSDAKHLSQPAPALSGGRSGDRA